MRQLVQMESERLVPPSACELIANQHATSPVRANA
jgi:hypothetical protein